MVFQHFNLFPHMTATENIMESLIHVKKYKKEDALIVAEKLLEKVRLKHRSNNYPSQLSGGEKQRIAIVRAFPNEVFDQSKNKRTIEFLSKIL